MVYDLMHVHFIEILKVVYIRNCNMKLSIFDHSLGALVPGVSKIRSIKVRSLDLELAPAEGLDFDIRNRNPYAVLSHNYLFPRRGREWSEYFLHYH